MGLWSWAKTAASNALVGSINFQEGQAPSTVNDSARALMADVAKWRDDISGALTTTGSAGVYALATNSTITALAAGIKIVLQANVASVGSDTLNVDSTGAKKIRVVDDTGERDIAANEWDANGFYSVIYDPDADSAAGAWILLGVGGAADINASDITNDSGVTGSFVSDALDTLDSDKAPLASPALTGTPTVDGNTVYHAGNIEDLPDAEVSAGTGTTPGLTTVDQVAALISALGGDGSAPALHVYVSSDTWTKPADLKAALVIAVGAGGDGYSSDGGSSSFGSHVIANGGGRQIGSSQPATPGSGGTGDILLSGTSGFRTSVTSSVTVQGGSSVFGGTSYGTGSVYYSGSDPYAGAGGETAISLIDEATLGATETVTIGAIGTQGSGGQPGIVVVMELY